MKGCKVHLFFLLTLQVIENHSKQQERQRLDDSTDLEQRDEDTQDEEEDEENEEEEEVEERVEEGDVTSPEVSFASQSSPYTDGRLVKSHSEAPIGSPKGESTPLLSVQSFLAYLHTKSRPVFICSATVTWNIFEKTPWNLCVTAYNFFSAPQFRFVHYSLLVSF